MKTAEVAPMAFKKASKQHVENIATGQHAYTVKLGGTLDEFNTASYHGTYGGCMRLRSKFQPNEYLVIENIGEVDVVNPHIVINGRRNWFSANDILAGILEPGMTDAEKAMAIFNFTSSIEVQAHDNNRRVGPPYPPRSDPSGNTFKERANPVKAANCYYCSGCQYAAANFVILCRHAGLNARAVWMCPPDKYAIHCVAETWYDDGWHLFDPERRTFFLEADNTTVASYEALHENPELCARTHTGGFASKGQKTHAPDYKKYYPPSIMPIEQWLSTMDMALRPGEKFVWRWDNIGKFRCGDNRRNINSKRPNGLIPYQLANGKLVYQPKLREAAHRRGTLSERNIELADAGRQQARLQPHAPRRPAHLIYRVSAPYPIVGGIVGGTFFRQTAADVCRICISVDGNDWIEVWAAEGTGEIEKYVGIDKALNPKPTPAIYSYRVKIELLAEDEAAHVGLSQPYMETDVQIAMTAQPSLSVGDNKVTYHDESGPERRVRIVHGWTESSATRPPLPPPSPAAPRAGGTVAPASLKKLAWRAATDPGGKPITAYHVQVSPRPDMLHPVSPNLDRIILSGNPQWRLPEGWLVNGRSYYWRVRARNGWGAWSNWSQVWQFKLGK